MMNDMKWILLVDDLRNFREEPENTVVARTSVDALKALGNSKLGYSEIWLDHDLGEPNGQLDSTMPVVDWLSEYAFTNDDIYPVDVIYVHTSNPVGRKNITSSLTRWGYNVVNVDAKQFFIV